MCEENLHYVFHLHEYTIQQLVKARDKLIWSTLTFCVSTALFKLAKASVWPIVPRKIGLNWFIPALVNSKVGSLWGTTEEEGTASSDVSGTFIHGNENVAQKFYMCLYLTFVVPFGENIKGVLWPLERQKSPSLDYSENNVIRYYCSNQWQ